MAANGTNVNDWLIGLAASIPFIGFWYKTRMDMRAEILDAKAEAVKCQKEIGKVELALAEVKLETAKSYVTKPHLREVVEDIKEASKASETRIVESLGRLHKKVDRYDRKEV